MKTVTHIATGPFSYIEFHGKETDLQKMKMLYNELAEVPKKWSNGVFEEIETFTGEKVLYNSEKHEYRDLDGNVLLSGSQYAKSKIKKFDKNMMSFVVGKKYGVDKDIISEMWDANGNISATFGTALHLAMEQWFKNKENGCGEKEYHIPKHPFLKKAVESFPLKDDVVWPELMISDVSRGFVGQIDGLLVTGDKEATIIDYKTDVEVERNLEKHSHQLSFYKSILEAKGWKIHKLEIWNYVDEWRCFELPVSEITL